MKWPNLHELVRLRLREATKVAYRLGHRLHSWVNEQDLWSAQCKKCGDLVKVETKGIGGPEITGPAGSLRCRPDPTIGIMGE